MHEAALAHRVILRGMGAIPRYLAALSPAALTQLRARWSEPCEAMFEFLAANYPQDLLKVVSATVLAAPVLTFAAEIAGRTVRTPAVRTALAPLLDHDSPSFAKAPSTAFAITPMRRSWSD